MRRLSAWLIRWAAVLILAGLAVAAVCAALSPLRRPEGWDALLGSGCLWACAAGLTFRLGLTRWQRGDPLEFLDTLEHELTHALTGYLTFAPPVSLKATLRKGGEVELRRTNPLVALAPYFLPLFTALAATLTLVLNPALLAYGRLTVAFLLGGFAYRLGREFHLGQSDFREFGLIFSFVSIAALLPLTLLAVLDLARILDIPWQAGVWPLFLNQFEKAVQLLFAGRTL